MSLAYETSEETVSPFRYVVPSIGLEPISIGLKDRSANQLRHDGMGLPPRFELGIRANLALIRSINPLFYH